jgi:hypothetical protein
MVLSKLLNGDKLFLTSYFYFPFRAKAYQLWYLCWTVNWSKITHYYGYIRCKHIGTVWGSTTRSIYFRFHEMMCNTFIFPFICLYPFLRWTLLALVNEWAWTGSYFQSIENMCFPEPSSKTGIGLKWVFSTYYLRVIYHVGYYLLSLYIMRPFGSSLCCKYEFQAINSTLALILAPPEFVQCLWTFAKFP